MRLDAFRHLVTLSVAGPVVDSPAGGFTETWVPLDPPTWYCSITAASAQDLERITGGGLTQQATHVIRGRWHPTLSKDCRITFGTRVFDVQSVHRRDERDVELEVIANELIGAVPPPPLPPQPPAPHAPTHAPGGSDPIAPTPPLAHAATHDPGGIDPIAVAPQQPPLAHAATHTPGGSDPIAAVPLPADVVVAQSVSIGATPARSGALRLENNQEIAWRAGADSYDVGIRVDGAPSLRTISIFPLVDALYSLGYATLRWVFGCFSDYVQIGTNPAQSGAIRLANSQAIVARNAANTADIEIGRVTATNYLSFGSSAITTAFDAFAFQLRPTENGSATFVVDGLGIRTTTDGTQHLGYTNARFKQAHLSEAVNVGTNPAQTGAIRLANNQPIVSRDGAGTGDRALIKLTAGSNVEIGPGFGQIFLPGTYLNIGLMMVLSEATAPAAPAVNKAHVWLQDNGAGKSQLMIQFATGAPIALATQV